jgi:protein-L-isoaspartate(D-aspartate) O-methyltransferase
MTSTQPLLFTVAFRRKMAELPQHARQEWLISLVRKLRATPGAGRASMLAQELREVARGCRLPLVDAIERQLGPFDPRHFAALLDVPRERFVRGGDVERSAEDVPLPLDDDGLATVSAPHAYMLSYRLLQLARGDTLVELGSGSGYGAALAAFIVGPEGSIVTFEIDEGLFAWATRTLAAEGNVTVVHADAMTSAPRWGAARKVVATFAVSELPGVWVDALPEGGRLVAPVGPSDRDQKLVLIVRRQGRVVETEHGAVRYVRNRSSR